MDELASGFQTFARRKRREATSAPIEHLATIMERTDRGDLRDVGNQWTRAHYGGGFHLVVPNEDETAVSLVFVQSRSGDTGGNPEALGGGATDKHLIYEGLSRVAADAVLAGARTIHAGTFFSVWHPELVSLRRALGLSRHPAQVVVSKRARVNFDAMLFEVPDVAVYVIAAADAMANRQSWLRERPWIRHIPLVDDDMRPALERLRIDEGIRRISAVGGRVTASRLVDQRLAQDVYLTTTSHEGGEPDTPWYSGTNPPQLEAITRKTWLEGGLPACFEHLLISRA